MKPTITQNVDEVHQTKWATWIVGLAIVLGLLAFLRARQKDDLKQESSLLAIHEVAPKLKAQGWINGEPPTSELLADKVVVVEAWGSACHVCWKIAPEMVEIYEQYHDRGVEFVGLTAQGRFFIDDIKAFVDENHIPWLNGYGAEVTMQQFGIGSLPAIFIIGRNGKIVWNHESSKPFTEALDRAIESPDTQAAAL